MIEVKRNFREMTSSKLP